MSGLTGDVSKELYDDQLQKIAQFKIILVTPEILKDGELIEIILSLTEKSQLEKIVFDKAHTIVSCGSTFRTVYKEVCDRLARVKCCPKLLLSATVPAKVETAIKDIFDNLIVCRSSVFRENLHLHIRERTNAFYDEVERFVADHKEFGIIYCVLPKDVSTIHAELLKRGVSCVKYHGQLFEGVKMANHSKWINGECKLIVANSSFGMGIDKKDVRFVIHARIPTSIDEYYQQCGRAGRDGLPSRCILYYRYADKNMLLKLFYSQGQEVSDQMSCVNELVNFLEDPVQCRHKCLMLYFGEPRENFVCGVGCDNCVCQGLFYLTDGTSDALKVVQTVVELIGFTLKTVPALSSIKSRDRLVLLRFI